MSGEQQNASSQSMQVPYSNFYYSPYQAPPFYNPYQARSQSIEQNYLQQSTQAMTIKGRIVSGIEEARAAQIDFDGSPHIFTDIANGRIYVKQIIQQGKDTGKAQFDIYEKVPQEQMAQLDTPDQAVQIGMLRRYLDEYTSDLRLQISDLENKLKEYGVNVQPDAVNGNAQRKRKSNGTFTTNSGE